MSLPGIGAKGVNKILELRDAKGDLELEDLNQVPYLRLTTQLINCLYFTSFEDKEGLGSLYDRHRERVRSVDQLVEKWEGTEPSHAKGRGKDWGQFDKVPSTGGKSYHRKQEGDWWQQSQSPERFEDEYSELDATFIERPTQGDIKVNQLRDNRSRHQFEERIVMILSENRAAMRGIGHICTTCILESQTYVLVMRSLGDHVFPIVGY